MNERSSRVRAGLIVLGLCSVSDVAAVGITGDGAPPLAVASAAAVLGLISLVLVVRAWRQSDAGMRVLTALRAVSAIGAVPALFADDMSSAAIGAATIAVALNVIGLLLLGSAAVTAAGEGPGRTRAA